MFSKIFEQKKFVFSIEVFPPKKTAPIDTIYKTLAGMGDLPLDYVSVTYGAGGSEAQKHKTLEISSLVRQTYNIEPLPHLTCITSTKRDVAQMLDAFAANGITGVLALRGDRNPDLSPVNDFEHASDLVRFIRDRSPDMNISGACYPEGHAECDSLEKDIEHLKIKADAGVSHLITQLFFDNDAFYRFRDRAAAAGIFLPIDAGIMPITNAAQIERTVSMCGASIPHKFAVIFSRYADNPEALRAAGVAYATEQIIDLIANGVRGIHLYTMNNIAVTKEIYGNIKSIIEAAK